MSNISSWSTTAASNNSPAPNGAPEGMAPSGVNDVIRENMAAVSKFYKDTQGTLVTAGSSNAYTLTTNNAHASLAAQSLLVFRADRANTGAVTLNVDGLGAKSLRAAGAVLSSGALAADVIYCAAYNSTDDAYDLVSGNVSAVAQVTRVISGLETSVNGTDSDHDIDITSGSCFDSGYAQSITLASGLTKRLDATWSAGTGNGGLSSSLTAPANNTWYHVFVVDINGAVDVLFDTSVTCANGVTDHGVDYYRRIASFKTNGSANIVKYFQFGNDFLWDVPVQDYASTSTTSAANLTLSVPTGIRVKADINAYGANSAAVLITTPDQTDTAPSTTVYSLYSSVADTEQIQMQVYTNTSAQIRHRASGSTSLSIVTRGWSDNRGQ